MDPTNSWGLFSNEDWWHTRVRLWSVVNVTTGLAHSHRSKVSCDGFDWREDIPGILSGELNRRKPTWIGRSKFWNSTELFSRVNSERNHDKVLGMLTFNEVLNIYIYIL